MRRTLTSLALTLVLPAALAAQAPDAAGDRAALIRSALSAGPESVTADATVAALDGTVLREGSNGWVCMPDDPARPGDSPMCLDAAWREFFDAYMNEREPDFDGVGFAYMLQGDFPVSNVDPFATEPTADNQWIEDGGPHIMMIVADPAQMEGIPTDPDNGGPWVMWGGTPYAHVMIPSAPLRR